MDEITPCLRDSRTGKLVATTYAKATAHDLKAVKEAGWRFDWEEQVNQPGEIYKLTLKNESQIQGLVALEIRAKEKACELHLTESAPQNIGKSGVYKGVGPHLFAIACKASKDAGFDGEVYFFAKTRLFGYYEKELGAIRVGRSHRMMIGRKDAARLMKIYIKG